MELHDLEALCPQVEGVLRRSLPGSSIRVSLEHADSPNPLCFFEVDGPIFAQGSFWANNEFRIEAMDTARGEELMNMSGEYEVMAEVLKHVRDLCDRAAEASSK